CQAVCVLPALCADDVVILVAPELSVVVMLAPVPSAPSRLEVQVIREARLPSSASFAVAVKVIAAPGSRVEPFAGAVMRTAGGTSTRIVVDARPVLPPPSVAAAGIVWVPGWSRPAGRLPRVTGG